MTIRPHGLYSLRVRRRGYTICPWYTWVLLWYDGPSGLGRRFEFVDLAFQLLQSRFILPDTTYNIGLVAGVQPIDQLRKFVPLGLQLPDRGRRRAWELSFLGCWRQPSAVAILFSDPRLPDLLFMDEPARKLLELVRAQSLSIIALLLIDEVVLIELAGNARKGFGNETVLGQ